MEYSDVSPIQSDLKQQLKDILAIPAAVDTIRAIGTLYYSERVTQKAIYIHEAIGIKTRRSKRRLLLILYCFYQAHQYLDLMVDPRLIAHKLDLNDTAVAAAAAKFSELITGFVPAALFTTPIGLLESYTNELGLAYDEELEVLTEKLLEAEPDLTRKQPQIVAAGVIAFHYRDVDELIEDKLRLKSVSFNVVVGLLEGLE